jgi:hypothetical protein
MHLVAFAPRGNTDTPQPQVAEGARAQQLGVANPARAEHSRKGACGGALVQTVLQPSEAHEGLLGAKLFPSLSRPTIRCDSGKITMRDFAGRVYVLMATCTFATAGGGFRRTRQRLLRCHTCAALVCTPCAARCHTGHYVKPAPEAFVYCQCGSGGACRAGGLRLSDAGTKYSRRMNTVGCQH